MKKESKYIFRRVVSGVLIALILTFIKSCDVYALSYYTNSPDGSKFTSVRIRNDGTNKNGTYVSTGDDSILTFGWTWTNLAVVNSSSNTFRFNFGTNYTLFNRYDNFVFNIYTKNLLVSGPISTYGFNGYCEITGISSNPVDSNEVPSSSYPRELYGLYGYNVVCHHDKASSGASRFDIPIQLLNYSEQAIYFSYYWTFYNNDNSTANAQAQAHADAVNTQNKIDNINNTINDSNVDSQSDFFSGFDEGSTGTLMDLISLPLDFVGSLNNSCQAISLPKLKMFSFELDLTIPCLSTYVYNQFGTTLINTLRLIINGLLIYRMLKWFIDFIQQLKDPNNDDLEVMDL